MGSRNSLRRISTAAALLLSAAVLFSLPLHGGKPVTVVLNGVTATGASASVDVTGDVAPTDFLTWQVTYPAGCAVTLQASLGGTVWETLATWSSSGYATGRHHTAPVGGFLYRLNAGTYAGAIAQTTGSGLSDVTLGGTYTGGVAGQTFEVEITAAAIPDVFRWRKGAGSWTTGVSITGAAQALADGVTVTFAATTGHDLGDVWTATFTGVYGWATVSGKAQIVTY